MRRAKPSPGVGGEASPLGAGDDAVPGAPGEDAVEGGDGAALPSAVVVRACGLPWTTRAEWRRACEERTLLRELVCGKD